MALDGVFLRHIKKELSEALLGARIDKLYQPNREELVLQLRTRQDSFKLLLSARANSPRVHLTRFAPENPKTPPMLCMLLRKRLGGAKLIDIRQPQLERILFFDFQATNELGDPTKLTLVTEIMGKYSNVILIDEESFIIDALKRVDAEMSSQRLVLPGLHYQLPPPQDKACVLEISAEEIQNRMEQGVKNEFLNKALMAHIQGISPVVSREIEHLVGRGADVSVKEMTSAQKERLHYFLNQLVQTVRETNGKPFMVSQVKGKPIDVSFMPIHQYGIAGQLRECGTFSQLLDEFYEERAQIDRMRAKSHDLLKLLTNISDRLSRKINAQQEELLQCAERDALRIYGDLLQANLYRIEKGASFADVENFYEENSPVVRIKLDPARSASQNAQKYYKDYRKANTAEKILKEQIESARQEMEYIDLVFDSLSRAGSEQELNEIRQELREQGYLRAPKGKQRPAPMMEPENYRTSDGFLVLCGRNNKQNDKLTLKLARNQDLWFHTKNIPGSHTVIVTEGKIPTETAIKEAAIIAAYNSRARSSSGVPVDYTQIKNVSKPQGAKPGMVIYVGNKTLYVTPDEKTVEKLRERKK